jgi:outer membrane receptor protein involved in Fe transport
MVYHRAVFPSPDRDAGDMHVRAAAIVRVLALLAAILCCADPALANGRLAGRLTRPDGSPLPGVTVVVDRTGATTLTDREGRFTFEDLSAGDITVTVTLGENLATLQASIIDGAIVTLDRALDWKAGYAETLTVRAVSHRPERLFEAPASAAVVPESTIIDNAAQAQVPRLLASIPGIELVQSGVFDFNINMRGINRSLNRRVLTLIDRRDTASVLVGAQEWATFGPPLDQLEAIEVVRGADSVLYGTNAFNGVVNITTKEPRFARGGAVELSAGELDSVRASAHHAGQISANWFYRVHGGYGRTDDFYRSRQKIVEYAGLPLDLLVPARDHTSFANAGLRLDHYFSAGSILTIEGGWAHSTGNMFVTGVGRTQILESQRPWVRSALRTPKWQLSAYYDGRYAESVSLASGAKGFDASERFSVDSERRFDYLSGRGRVVVGAAARYERSDTRDASGVSSILRDVESARQGAVFAQVAHGLSDRFKVVLGARADKSTLYGLELAGRAGVICTVAPAHGIRFTYNHAFDTGSFVQYFTRGEVAPAVTLAALEAALKPVIGSVPLHFERVPVLALGNEQLGVERVDSLEVGYSGLVARKVVIGANAYWNRISNLISPLLPQVGSELGRVNPAFGPYTPPSALTTTQRALVLGALEAALPASLLASLSNDTDGSPIFAVASFANFARVNVRGIETSVQYFITDNWTVDAGYSWLVFSPRNGVSDRVISANAPPHAVTAGPAYRARRVSASLRYRRSSAFAWNDGIYRGVVPTFQVFDLSASYKVTPRTTVLANVANVFDKSHFEMFGGDLLGRRALLSIRQSW